MSGRDKTASTANGQAIGTPLFSSASDETNRSVGPELNILILSTDLPIFPGGGGVEYLKIMHMASLADHVGLVSMAHTRNALERVQGLADAGVELYLWRSPAIDQAASPKQYPALVRRAHGLLRSAVDIYGAGLRRPRDTLIINGCFRNMSAGIREALARRSWPVLLVIQSTSAAMIDYLPLPMASILVMHDIRALMYLRRALTGASASERRYFLDEARRYFAFERAYCQRYDLVVTVSQHDAAWVRKYYQPKRVITAPIPVDASYFSPQPATLEQRARIVFTGLMNHPPNVDAAVYFAREILPEVRAVVPEAEFFIVGRNPAAEVLALSGLPGVHVTGEVADVRPYIAEATVFVVPLRYGSGTRQKILEAWAMEKCVVSTTIGAEGLDYQDGKNIIIADDKRTMAESIVRLIRHPELRDQVRRAGRNLVLTGHDPQRIAAEYYAEIRSLVEERTQDEQPMRVALDMRWMYPGAAGGLENLARSFLRELIELDRYNRYTVILPARCRYDFDLRGRHNIRTMSIDSVGAYLERVRRKVSRAIHARLRLDYWESQEVLNLRFQRALDAEIVYSFPGYIFPDVVGLRHVLMVPDIQHEYFPEFFSEDELEERRRLYGDSIRRADHICAISEFTRQTLIERLGVPPEKITAVPLAADPIFSDQPQPDHDARVLRKYGLSPGGYFYFPAHTWLHKNHRTVVAALHLLKQKRGLTPLLVCSGGTHRARPALDQQIAELGLEHQVRFLGYCPQEDIPALYRNAISLVFPSLFEGFGMPVLEAMACGCPVICSNTTSLPEIAGDAALLIDPLNAEAWADALFQIVRHPELRAELRKRGLQQAQQFSWRRHTLETVRVLYRVHRRIRGL